MFYKASLIRWLVVFACLVAGVFEFFALQRVRLQSRISNFDSLQRLD